MKAVITRFISFIVASALVFIICGCNNPKTVNDDLTPEEFAKEFILATNKPDAEAVDNYTLGGGEEYYQYEAKKQNQTEEEYYLSISDNKAKDYKTYMEYQNTYRVNYLYNKFGTRDLKTDFTEVKAEKLDDKKLKKVKELVSDYSFVDTDLITEPYKVCVKFETAIAEEVTTEEMYILVVRYNGTCKYVVSTDTSENFDSGFEDN